MHTRSVTLAVMFMTVLGCMGTDGSPKVNLCASGSSSGNCAVDEVHDEVAALQVKLQSSKSELEVGNNMPSTKSSINVRSDCTGTEYCAVTQPGPEHCGNDELTSSASSGQVECQSRCDEDPECFFFSLWQSGGLNWCSTTKECTNLIKQWGQTIVVFQKPNAEIDHENTELENIANKHAELQALKDWMAENCPYSSITTSTSTAITTSSTTTTTTKKQKTTTSTTTAATTTTKEQKTKTSTTTSATTTTKKQTTTTSTTTTATTTTKKQKTTTSTTTTATTTTKKQTTTTSTATTATTTTKKQKTTTSTTTTAFQCTSFNTEYASCGAWGDPHFTSSFDGSHFDFMGLGLYDLASTSDGRFQLQAFQGPYKKFGTSIFRGFALKLGDTRVTIIRKNITIDGVPMTGSSHPSGIQVTGDLSDGDQIRWTSPDGCEYFFLQEVEEEEYYEGSPVWYYTFYAWVDKLKTSKTGVCGAPDRTPLHASQSLFSESELASLCQISKLEDCETFKPPEGWVALNSPEEACNAADISFEVAQNKCKTVTDPQFNRACIYDYCASDGNDFVVSDAILSNAEEIQAQLFTTVTTTPEPCLGNEYCERASGEFYCFEKVVSQFSSAGKDACESKCDDDPNCKFMSIWLTGSANYCLLSEKCELRAQQAGHNILIREKPLKASTLQVNLKPSRSMQTPYVKVEGPGHLYCSGTSDNILSDSPSSSKDECMGRCDGFDDCKFVTMHSIWESGHPVLFFAPNWCRLTKGCQFTDTHYGRDISIFAKPVGDGQDADGVLTDLHDKVEELKEWIEKNCPKGAPSATALSTSKPCMA